MINDYALAFTEKRPLEALFYLRLLVNPADVEKDPKKIQIISNFIFDNNHVSFFFENTREAERNVYYYY